MTNLIKKITKNIIFPLAVAGIFSFNAYSQKIEKTEDGFKQYNKKGQLFLEVEIIDNDKLIAGYNYNDKGQLIEEKYIIDHEKDGKIYYTSYYKYDDKRQRIKIEEKLK